MKVAMFLIILTILCQNAITAKKNLQSNRLLFDLTRPVNELLGGEISQQEFLSDVNSAIDLIGANGTNSTIFYVIAGTNIEELESRTEAACKIIQEILGMSSDSQLLISWKLNGTTKDTVLDLNYPYNKTFVGNTSKLLLHIDNEYGCDLLLNLPDKTMKGLFDPKDGMFVGISYDESLHDCPINDMLNWPATIFLVNLKFGSTIGVTESFGLFQTRMKFLSEKTLDFTQFVGSKNPQILYYPVPNSVGENEHQRLLIHFASIWTSSDKTVGSMLLQVPNLRNNVSTPTQFSITPNFTLYNSEKHASDEVVLSSLSLFVTSFQKHQMIFLNEYIWDLWHNLPQEKIQTLKRHNKALSTDVALDCDRFIWDKLNSSSTQPRTGKLVTIVVNINEGELSSLPPKICERLTSKTTVGCKFERLEIDGFKNLNESVVENVVRACQRLNGSVYILSTQVKLEYIKEQLLYSFTFENTIRKELHAVNRFRKAILQRVPLAKVFLKLEMVTYSGSQIFIGPQKNSWFCDELVPTENLYFEGIFNWAQLENFPIIKSIIDVDATSYFPEWLELLRQLNYPYPDWGVKERKGQAQSGSVRKPAFLMQNYLKSIHDWEPDSCIDWNEKRLEITDDFFHNSKIGTLLNPDSILWNRTLTEKEYITMLQFLFYRFRLVEISISFDIWNLLSAIDTVMESQDFNADIFMKYPMTEADNWKDLQKFTSFVSHLKKSKLHKKGLLKGVHTELVVESGMDNANNNSDSKKIVLVLNMMKFARLSNLSCGIELPSLLICNRMLEKFTFSEENAELLGTINYFVCNTKLSSLNWRNDKIELQFLLDSYLTLKRTLHQMIPHLRIYIRVEFDFEINFESNAALEKYTGFLALLKAFGTQYDIGYFVGVAFDGQLLSKLNGWWGITNYSDLANAQSYVEKVTVFRGQQMWYPSTSLSSMASGQDFSLVIIVSSVSSVVVFFLIILVVSIGLRYRKLQHLSQFLSDSEVQEFLNGRIDVNTERNNTEMDLMGSAEHIKFNQEYKLGLPDLTIDFEKILGSGAFGTVYKGLTKDTPAAIKRPNADCSKTTFKSVLTEVKVLSYIGNHSNVVGFLGAYVDEIHNGVLYISTELCSGGSLEAFLRTKSGVISQNAHSKLGTSEIYIQELNTFAMEIAQGMEYIESKRVVHGDLATRNVLLDDNLVCKIGDFGLTRKLYEYQKYVKTSQEPLPWKWMAHESLTKMEFTSKSDVWSYGVTIWEIYSLGKIPYAGLNWSVDFAKDLQNGLRLTVPDFAPENIFSKMLDCWNMNPDERPTFAEFVKFYKGLGESVYTVLDLTE